MVKPGVKVSVGGKSAANNRHRGTTAQRPTEGMLPGFEYFNEDLGHPEWWDGRKWTDSLGGTAIIGLYKSLYISDDITCEEHPSENTQTGVIFVNVDDVEHYVNISNETYKTPDGEMISIAVPVGGYAEANFLNVGGEIYVRGI